MTHYVFLRFKKGYLTNEIFLSMKERFLALADAVDGVSDCHVERNIAERDVSMDFMMTCKMSSPELLPVFLKHPLHLAIASDTDPHVDLRVTFDY